MPRDRRLINAKTGIDVSVSLSNGLGFTVDTRCTFFRSLDQAIHELNLCTRQAGDLRTVQALSPSVKLSDDIGVPQADERTAFASRLMASASGRSASQ